MTSTLQNLHVVLENHSLWFRNLRRPSFAITTTLVQKDPFIEILRIDFARKKMRNKAYSLRSYSRALDLDPSNLSKLLNYRKELGPQLKAKLAHKIGFTTEDLAAFTAGGADIRDQAYELHNLEAFQLVADWQHYAILELFKTKSFKPSIAVISARLDLTVAESKASLARLERAGLLKKDKDGILRPVDESSSSILSVATSKAHREQQKQILEGAIEAIEQTPIEDRSQSSITFAIDTEKLEQARKLIKKFRRQLGRLLSQSEKLDEVYQLSVSLYPVTKKLKETLP